MTTEQQLSFSSAPVAIEQRRAEAYRLALCGACAELSRAQQERDALRGAIDRALQDLRSGWPEAALDVLARALGGPDA